MWSLPDTPEVISSLGNLVTAGAAFWAAYTASRGLVSWKKEKNWERNTGLSEEMMVLLYRRRDAFVALRNSPGFVGPSETTLSGELIDDPDMKFFWSLVKYYEEKIADLNLVQAELYERRFLAEIRWGEDLETDLKKLDSFEQRTITEARRFLRAENPNSDTRFRDAAFSTLKREILFQDFETEDTFGKEYTEVFERSLGLLKQKLVEAGSG
jgi:hypothetical protein